MPRVIWAKPAEDETEQNTWFEAAEAVFVTGDTRYVRGDIVASMLGVLATAEIAVEQLCFGQDEANECWTTLQSIREIRANAP